jgi:predicted transcriptional regulator
MYAMSYKRPDGAAFATLTVRVGRAVKQRLVRLSDRTGRSHSFLAAEALNAYLDVNEWQIAGIKKAVASLDRGAGIPHGDVERAMRSWARSRSTRRRPSPA